MLPNRNKQGGHNFEEIGITKEVFDLIKNTYNLKHRYVSKLQSLTIVNPILMSVESGTIGFIENCLKDIIEVKRQYKLVGPYFVDCYIPKLNIVIECDEHGHSCYNKSNEILRETFIKKTIGCDFIRFNPDDECFDLSIIINKILKMFCIDNANI